MTGYLVAIATLVGIRALLTLGLNVQWGLTGLVNLGVVAFFAIGAYTSGLLAVSGVALPLGGAAALVTSGIAGRPSRNTAALQDWDGDRRCARTGVDGDGAERRVGHDSGYVAAADADLQPMTCEEAPM